MQFELAPSARNDLKRIYLFNLARTRHRADSVEQRLFERMGQLSRSPNLGRWLNNRGVMRLSIADIQYVIDYKLVDDGVRILRVRHTREVR